MYMYLYMYILEKPGACVQLRCIPLHTSVYIGTLSCMHHMLDMCLCVLVLHYSCSVVNACCMSVDCPPQVSHHPPMFAMHVEHKDWTFWEEYTVASKFRGKYIACYPIGITHLLIHTTD